MVNVAAHTEQIVPDVTVVMAGPGLRGLSIGVCSATSLPQATTWLPCYLSQLYCRHWGRLQGIGPNTMAHQAWCTARSSGLQGLLHDLCACLPLYMHARHNYTLQSQTAARQNPEIAYQRRMPRQPAHRQYEKYERSASSQSYGQDE